MDPAIHHTELAIDYARLDDEHLVEPFDSIFEQRVFRRIKERGFHVIPQYEVAGRYRIDLVVVGEQRKLAVECDGERWHGPERFESDFNRQRQLERAGWKFVRLRGSEYFRNPDAALSALWRELELLGIKPKTQTEPGGNSQYSKSWVHQVNAAELPKLIGQPLSSRQQSPEPSPLSVLTEVEFNTAASTHSNPKVEFSSYVSWETRQLQLPDLSDSDDVASELLEIILTEGPILLRRAFELYVQACGLGSLQQSTRTMLNKATHVLKQQPLVILADEMHRTGQIDTYARHVSSPPVVIRSGEERELVEIPPSEFAAVLAQFINSDPSTAAKEVVGNVFAFFDKTLHMTDSTQRRYLEAVGEQLTTHMPEADPRFRRWLANPTEMN